MIKGAEKFVGKERYTFEDLVEIMRLLRDPNGCPWDKEQTHKSIRQNFIEETYEAVEAIDNDDAELLREELGDVMLQVVFHAIISQESGDFCVDDVITGVCAKLVLRHPHIFADTDAKTTDKVLDNWEKIKTVEKHYSSTGEKIDSISKAMPSLMRANKIGEKCRKAGFDFANAKDASEKIAEETRELLYEYENGNKEACEEEAGDLLLAAVNTVRLCGVDSEKALYNACEKYIRRYRCMEEAMLSDGKNMSEISDTGKNEYWEKVKNSSKCTKISQ